MHIVESWTNFDILEQGHAKDTEDKHDQNQKKTNIQQGWHSHDQGK